MSTTTTLDPEVVRYLDAVRAHLADLPVDERDELLEDLEAHLVEVAAESDEPLADRLGPPDAYAADLRASAGYPPAGATLDLHPRVARARRRWDAVIAHPWAQRVRGFLPELRPAWWVLRAVLAVWVLAMVFGSVDAGDIPFPPLFGSRFVGLVATVVAAPLSVTLGRRQAGDARLTRKVHVAEAALLVLTIPLVAQLNDRPTVYVDYGSVYPPATGELVGADGQPITNFFATDEDGQPIERFRLYDQNGMPVTNVADSDELTDPEGVIRSQVPIDRDGRPVPNGYPRATWLERYDGSTATVTPPIDAATTTVAPEPTTAAPPATTTTVP
jgi:hypothetical protein